MITFKQFLVESDNDFDSFDEVQQTILARCKPYLDANPKLKKEIEAGNLAVGMFRGVENAPSPALIKTVRKDRKAKDSSERIHELLDTYLEKQFGHKFRSAALFTTETSHAAKLYGRVFTIFPIGDYEFCFSTEIDDPLYLMNALALVSLKKLESTIENYNDPALQKALRDWFTKHKIEYTEEALDEVQDDNEKLSDLVDTMFDACGYKVASKLPQIKGELMLKCEKYIAVDRIWAIDQQK